MTMDLNIRSVSSGYKFLSPMLQISRDSGMSLSKSIQLSLYHSSFKCYCQAPLYCASYSFSDQFCIYFLLCSASPTQHLSSSLCSMIQQCPRNYSSLNTPNFVYTSRNYFSDLVNLKLSTFLNSFKIQALKHI